MPAKTETRLRSRSPGRPAKKASSRSSRSRSRSRSRGRSKSPARRRTKSVTSESPSRQSRTPKPKVAKTPTTPTRHSRRLEEKAEKEQHEEEQKEQQQSKAAQEEQDVKDVKPRGKKSKYEFGGPIMAFLMMLGLPAMVLLVNLACTQKLCSISIKPHIPLDWKEYLDPTAAAIFFGWLLFQVVLAVLPIGAVAEGLPLKYGKKLSYRCNGSIALLTSVAAFGALVYFKKPVSLAYEKFVPMAVTASIFSLVFSVYLYLRARKRTQKDLSKGGNTGNFIYDFFMGRELNPRIGSLDLKFFCELRPGLIGWVMLNLVFVTQAYSRDGAVSPALALVAAFQTLYVADALWFEDAMLSTMDITTEGFGFMLAFGDLAWVPFLYCLQPRYLLEHTMQWSYWALAGFVLLKVVGYIIFRGSNSQKDRFRKNPHDPALTHLDTIPTPSGKKLLASGWWGLVRHPNYLGDIIMSLAWSLPCGFVSAIPYFYPLYFTILLMHRASRDDAHCRQKHGAAWDRYCLKVKYRIIPYVY